MKKFFAIIFYPFVLLFSIFIILYIIIRSYFSSTKVTAEYEPISEPISMENYSIYLEINDLKIYSIYAGEIRMGPVYLGFKSEPRIQEIETGIYGDWFYKTETGIYFQKWNSTKNPNADLVFIDFKNLNVQTIKSNISSVNWKIESINGKLVFNDFSGTVMTIN